MTTNKKVTINENLADNKCDKLLKTKKTKQKKNESIDGSNVKSKNNAAKKNIRKERPLMTGKEQSEPRGVILIKNLPIGFEEPQLRRFFSQFGTVTRLRLMRSKKTSNSKGYAFIEFESQAVAQIAADTMDGYLLFGKIMSTVIIKPEAIREGLFKFRRIRPRGWNVERQRERLSRKNNNKISAEHRNKMLKKDLLKTKKIKELGIDYIPPPLLPNKKLKL